MKGKEGRYWLIQLALFADILVRPSYAAAAGTAQSVVWAQIFSTALLALFVQLFFRCLPLADAWPPALFAAALVLALACGSTLMRAERFYRMGAAEPLPAAVTLTVLGAAALYAASCGLRTLGRTASLLGFLLLGSFALLVAANADGMYVTHLVQNARPWRGALEACATQIYLPPELLLMVAFDAQEQPEKTPQEAALARRRESAVWMRAVLGRGALACALAVVTELVLGVNAQQYLQTLQTLSRLGGISVFRRLDALHGMVWLLVLLCKGAGMLCAAAVLIQKCAACGEKRPEPEKRSTHWPLVAAGAAALCGMGMEAAGGAELLQCCGTIAVALCALLACRKGETGVQRQIP